MTKQSLIGIGLTEEQATKVMEQLNGSFIPKSRFDEVNTDMKNYREMVKERDGQLEELKKAVGNSDELKKQIDTLQKDNKAKEDAFNSEIKKLKINNAVEKALTEAKAKNLIAVKALLNLENAELSEDGSIKGLSDKIKALSESQDTSFLFDVQPTQTNTTGGFVPTQKKDGVPDASSTFETRLAEARKNGDTLEAIRIKQEASAEGVMLL